MSNPLQLPLIVQSDRTILLEVNNPLFAKARQAITGFAELIKSPEYIHTYRITPLSLWNAAASGFSAEQILDSLQSYSKFGIPPILAKEIQDTFSRYGLIRLEREEDSFQLVSDDPLILEEVLQYPSLQPYVTDRLSSKKFLIAPYSRGLIKHELIKLGYPVQDIAGYTEGEPLSIALSETTAGGRHLQVRDYQQEAIQAFYAGGSVYGGNGVLVLPCGAGKTVIGIGTMSQIQTATLILTTNTASVRQWISEILDKTNIAPSLIGEYTGEQKDVKPITVTTYQMLTYHRKEDQDYPHMALFHERDWGLLIYDEVHLLPAPVFRMTASIQAKRRLGLTATLIREDGREDEVFSLVGPKRYDMSWQELAEQDWIAKAQCKEVRLSFEPKWREAYAHATIQQKYRIASENPRKLDVLSKLVQQHREDQVLIIGQYIDQLEKVAEHLKVPLITGKVKEQERQQLYQQFKTKQLKCLIVSKVANFAIDLPDANVAIQISGTYGSRQEEAQRLGRILRPKPDNNTATFYTLVTRDTREQEFAAKRQLFLIEQGYRYENIEEDQLTNP
ncbi:DNA repair helicase XPB [Brevibacillus ginsengisoli]|uniref:DNA repair helicase XPB n=1 Tax=Brevibacillus ginsengisoli TaxID=363854 RepID=UPI003CF9BF11